MTFKEQLNEAKKRMGVARLGMLLVAGILLMILTWYGEELGKLFPLGFGVIGLLVGLVLRESSEVVGMDYFVVYEDPANKKIVVYTRDFTDEVRWDIDGNHIRIWIKDKVHETV